MGAVLVGIFNSAGILDKAHDAQRKKDLGRIKVAFEEYYNDIGCYPDSDLANKLNTAANCGTRVFSPWLTNWPCNQGNIPYIVIVEDIKVDKCSKWYKVLTNLANKSDISIPSGWSYLSSYYLGSEITAKMVNYGISSSNINWFDVSVDPICAMYGGCYYNPDPVDQPNLCNSAGTGCVGPNCFLGQCKNSCIVTCCGVGCK